MENIVIFLGLKVFLILMISLCLLQLILMSIVLAFKTKFSLNEIRKNDDTLRMYTQAPRYNWMPQYFSRES